MAAKALFLILALAFIAGSQSARILDESDSKVQTDPCSYILFRPLYCYLPPTASPATPASPVVTPSPPAAPVDPCSRLILRPLYCYLPPTSPTPPASPVVTPSPPAAPVDPCSHLILRPLYCYLPHPSPPASPVVTPSPPATPVVTPSPPATHVTPSPPATHVTPSPPATPVTPSPPATATCTPAYDLLQNCGAFFINRIAHDNCCQEVNALSDSCLDNDVIFNLIERELISFAKQSCAQTGSNAATEALVISP